MLRTSLCHYSDAHILVSRTITITGAGDHDAVRQLDEITKGVISKNGTPFKDCISDAKHVVMLYCCNVVMLIYNDII